MEGKVEMPGRVKGRIFDVSHGCVEDGPGLRTVVFLKGCNLGCPWCQNVEGVSFKPEVSFDPARCIGCGRCQEACGRKWRTDAPDAWRDGCLADGRCVEACPSGARRLAGREYDAKQLLAEVIPEEDFLKGAGGGVTFSGGEPLCQPDFLFECAAALRRRGISVAVETAGFWRQSLAARLAAETDLVLFDLKHVDPEKLRKATGKDAETILGNFQGLLDAGAPVELRLTIVPGFNDSDSDLEAIASRLNACSRVPRVTLVAFHRLAVSKQTLFGRRYPYAAFPPISAERLAWAASRLRELGVKASTG